MKVVRSRSYDAVLLQREMLSSLTTLEGLTGRPRILDVDDAIHLLRVGKVAQKLAGMVDRIICGNTWLADWYARWNANVVVMPTGVDTARYVPTLVAPVGGRCVIGWIGTSANFGYLQSLESALAEVLRSCPSARLLVVSDRAPSLPSLDPATWTFSRWSEATEIADIQRMDIGIMPLRDSDWARGKCSFKMLQYMACGLPVVVSPVGMNAEVLAQGACGHAATSTSEWIDALTSLVSSEQQRATLGGAGRKIVEQSYSLAKLVPQFANHLRGY